MIENINEPKDLKKLSFAELDDLTSDIRKTIIDTVSKNGGHLASNLGMIEATIALHRVFDSPNDKFIFDVSHQSYTHKLLTGRYSYFSTLRQFKGISGFTNRNESVHDILSAGHSGSSISAALGIATANKLRGSNDHTIAIVGDGSLTNGMIYEALNNCGDKKLNLIILINDNEMSISKNVGGLHKYLNKIRTSNGYFRFKRKFEYYLSAIPLIGGSIARVLKLIKDALRRLFVRDTIFEDLGLVYVGPVDGHNIEKMSRVLTEAKSKHQCCVVHMITRKGNGYTPAENEPHLYHGVGHFDAEYGIDHDDVGVSFSSKAGEFLCDLAKEDDKICAITAAMSDGTGLREFSEKFPKRFFDVGIAEEHAITFAGGLSVVGMKPVVALYSTFSQRVYDQLQHDIALQDLPLTLLIDRAGLVPGDGITHQGIFDYSVFSTIPNVSIFVPSTYSELKNILKSSLEHNKDISIVRYPKGGEVTDIPEMISCDNGNIYHTENIKDSDVIILTYGRMVKTAFESKKLLSPKYNVGVIKAVRTFPLDFSLIEALVSDCKLLYIIDECYKEGSMGEKISSGIKIDGKIHINAVNDFLDHGSLADLMRCCSFTPEQISDEITSLSDQL
ncbi:MAG: 1-deoxy-D-xylulose-5-phosphate synthase [Ruminococcaceae bacterium]|nr:1-deoxy-D-xylulose-5-phosphate synthase [Oscillospiraceae bacterium]